MDPAAVPYSISRTVFSLGTTYGRSSRTKGEAEKLIQHLNISSENYEICWEILNHRYNNLKLIFNAHINNLLSIPTMQNQSYTQIKKLHDTTNESLNAVMNLGVDIKSWDPLIVYILSQKLDVETYTEYVESLKNPRDLPTLKDFLSFMEMKFTSFESSRRKMDTPKSSHHQAEQSKKQHYKSYGGTKESSPSPLNPKKEPSVKSSYYQRNHCPVCNKKHGIFHCESFLGSTADEKRKIIAKHNLCKNCLYNHYEKECFSNKTCSKCQEQHNSIVHDIFTNNSKSDTARAESSNRGKSVNNITKQCNIIEILLATALIKVQSANGQYITMRALIDQGSQMSLITENAAQLLKLPRQKCKGVVFGIGAKGNTCKGAITIITKALHSSYQFSADLVVMKTLMNCLPNRSFYKPTWSHLNGIPLADPEFYISRPIDILLGADVYTSIIQGGIIKENESLPIAQQTRLGWILSGKVPSFQCNIVVNNMDDIQRFWNIEDIAEKSELSTQDQYCLTHYQKTTTRQTDGRYVVCLPLKPENQSNLGLSRPMAIAQFMQLEKKLQKNPDIAREYKSFIHEYIELGHMYECTYESPDTSCYLPHHCVQRADSLTTTLRVVFNASAKTSNGMSLNDIMYSGPNLQQELLSLIIKWRQYEIAFTADIEKMFRQIKLNIDHQKYQKIIWRDSPKERLREYKLSTVTYGTKSAPFLAMMTLRQLAKDERQNCPDAAKAVEESFYMDDLLHGSHNIESAKQLQSDLIMMMRKGGFNLRKWSSNRPELLEGVSTAQDLQESAFEFKDQQSTKTLGLRWNPKDDQFSFNLKIEPPSPSTKITKRILLSNISKIFDPLGWLSPLSTKLKLLFQNLLSHQLEWDDEVPSVIKSEWEIISQDLHKIKKIEIPRWLQVRENQDVELHGFCDASIKSYACVIYCRIKQSDQHTRAPILVAAKSRLVPTNKDITLPRLELCAAVLLSTLMKTVTQSLSGHNIKTFGWSDSTAVLGWLNGEPSKWKPFVSNRVVKVTGVMPADCWSYVRSEDNPADCASRGIKVDQLLTHPLWWHGPDWLQSYNQTKKRITYDTDKEIKIKKQNLATTRQSSVVDDVIERCSSLTRATRIVAWMLRITSRQPKPSYLTTDELNSAAEKIIKHVQKSEFPDDIKRLENKEDQNSKSGLINLKPFLDQKGLLRVGGRITNSHINWEIKHPLIIPKKSRLTELIIDQAHKATLHGGARLTLAYVRQKYWILGGNRITKSRLRLCVTCRRQRPTNQSQLMGDLPELRSVPTRPFYNTGVDFTGFVNVKASKGRGIKTTKGYVAVFVCMVTKAVHLELVSDLTSESFLAALRRMSARRGAPGHIFSDNGTNFVGASKLIKKEFAEIKATLDDKFLDAISEMNIKWHFNAPSGPSAGGLWEAAVKSMKYHLCRVLGDQKLTFEEFATLLTQIEACLNARPLCALSEDPDDIDYLTPSHFLASGPTLHILETERDERTRWRMTQKIFNDIWKRWQSEYLCQLQSRCKWTRPTSNMKIGDVVIIHDANLPAGKWALGRVVELHPGKDGLVRVVSLKTKNGIIKRPIIKVSILPVTENNSEESAPQENQNKIETPTKKTIQSKPRSTNLALMLLFFLPIITAVQCTYNISYFKSDQGFYFDKLSNVKLTRDEWNLVAYYDINPYWQGQKLLSRYINYLDNACQSFKDHSQCHVVMLQLRHGYSELNYYNDLLLGRQSDHARKKRGLINGIGYVANSLFGVLDQHFAEQYEKDIALIRDNQKHLSLLWKNQTSVVEAEYNLMKRIEGSMDKQHKIFNNHLNILEKSAYQFSKQLQFTADMNEFTLSSVIANNILMNLKNIQDVLIDTITDVIQGHINIHLLTPQQLKRELSIIKDQISNDLSLPYDRNTLDLTKLYKLLRVKARMTNEFMIFEIKIPLVNIDTYELYRLASIPHQHESQMISIQPISSYVAINIKRELFKPILDDSLEKCIHFDSSVLICQLKGPIYKLKSDQSLCVKDQITSGCKTETDTCKNKWSELNTINTYLFFCCNQCTIKIVCGQDMTTKVISKAGLITIGTECIIMGDGMTIFSHGKQSNQMRFKVDAVQVEVPPINRAYNLSIPPLNPINTTATSNETQDENQKYFEIIQQKIDHMKNEGSLYDSGVSYHDVHHYVAIYVVAGVVMIMVALYSRQCYLRRRRSTARLAESIGLSSMGPRPSLGPPAPPAPLPLTGAPPQHQQARTVPAPRALYATTKPQAVRSTPTAFSGFPSITGH